MITFQNIPPNEIELLPTEAIKYLEDAIKRTPGSTHIADLTIDMAKKGFGNVYTVFNNNQLVGACYLLVCNSKEGKVVTPVLVGGEYMYVWQDAFYDFLYDFCQKTEAVKVRWVGRKGWGKAYPNSKVIGHIFEHDITPRGGL